MANSIDRILWLDCIGGLVVGCAVLAFCGLLSDLENLPISIVGVMGFANLIYGGYSFFVTTRRNRSKRLVGILAIANMTWLFICVSILIFYWHRINTIGLVHVLGEGVYVATLGLVEWRMRERLSRPRSEFA